MPTEAMLTKLAEYYDVPYEDLRILYYDDYFNRHKKERAIVVRWVRELVDN